MSIVWPTPLSVEEYALAGQAVLVPRLECPGCGEAMVSWGCYERDLRVGLVWRLVIRRQRCGACATSHAVLPGFVTQRRLDAVEVIGSALVAMTAGRGARPVARAIDVAHTTVRDWKRRFGARAVMLGVGFCRFVVAAGGVAPRLAGSDVEVAMGAIEAAWALAARRLEAAVGVLWRFANAVVGGELLSTNTDPPWSAT
ncbi:MAG: DUF6431 domain-containing protein [Acidimicrobiales bacterium]